MSDKKKVYMLSDSIHATTGNAKVAKELLLGLKDKGYEVGNLAIGADQPESELDGIKMLPITQHGFNNSSVEVFLNKLTGYIFRDKPDFVIILGDRIHYQSLGIGNLEKDMLENNGTRLIFWETVDSDVKLCMENSMNDPVNPKMEIYRACHSIVTTSEYGRDVLEDEFIKVDKVIWEFVDTERYISADDKRKLEIRMEYRFRETDFIFLTIGRCMRRKNPELVLEALYPVLIENENARVFCVIPEYNAGDELNLIDFCKRVLTMRYGGRDLIAEQKVLFCTVNKQSMHITKGIDEDELIKFYQLSDAVISGSSNEGFNLIFGEAMSVGLPYIGINNTTIPELTNNNEVGFIAPADHKIHVGQSMLIGTTSIESLREQARKVIALSKEELKGLKKTNREFIEKKIPKQKMIDEWDNYLKSISIKKEEGEKQ